MSTELSGVDLARQALVAARETAKNGATHTKKPKQRTQAGCRVFTARGFPPGGARHIWCSWPPSAGQRRSAMFRHVWHVVERGRVGGLPSQDHQVRRVVKTLATVAASVMTAAKVTAARVRAAG